MDSARTRKHWIRSGAALLGVAAVTAGSLVAAAPASAASREVQASPAPFVWKDIDQFGVAKGLSVSSDAETITVELPAASASAGFTEWSHPGYETVDWRLSTSDADFVSGSSAVDAAANTIEIPLERTVGSFEQPAVRLDLTAEAPQADDAYVPPALESTTGFDLSVTAGLTVAPASGEDAAVVDLSATTPSSTRHDGVFWAGGGSLTDAGAGDVVVVETGVPGFFGTSVRATVGTDGTPALTAPAKVLDDGSSVAVKPNQDFYDRYQNFGDTSLTGAPSIRVTGAGRGVEQPAGSAFVVRVPLRVVASTTPPTTGPTPGNGPTVTRLAGTDRQGTAVEISKATFATPGVPVVYIATGANFPDALSAGPAAAKQGGPLLLVDRDSVSQVVRDELTRLKPQRIVVVGSDLSVSDALATDLGQYANGRVFRLGGTDRYDTSRKIIESAFEGTSPKGAWLATGEKFPDALSATAAAGKNSAPVVLVNGGLPAADPTTVGILTRLRPPVLTIAGSELSVSAGIQNSLTVPAGPLVTRFGGVDRYDTSEQLNRAAFPRGSETVFLATGENFPDALAGAAAAGRTGSPLFAVPPTCVPVKVLQDIKAGGATSVVLLGGTGTLSDAVAKLTPCS
ncbi:MULTISPECIES: cell wall-binding repeat-containing protein [unclassified Rathayibacter]|uniref:cell wall-binding repeat-containing protein n=1 Tax=unclassified Rathayibacter TaxID=2609250 RepID=UPI0011B0E2EC|nr:MULTISPECIES: cell wall-binding repeat-containing protein [unclassified Rathayibacter]